VAADLWIKPTYMICESAVIVH